VHIPEGGNFLDRERAVLGDDAAQFEGPNDHLAATVEDAGDDDLLGGAGDYQPEVGDQDLSAFESQFPAIDTTNDVGADNSQ
jgi:Clathrin light chain